jgi:AraC family transcriptional regulator
MRCVDHTILPAARLMQTLQSPASYDTIISEMVRGGAVDFETRYPIDDPLVSQVVSTLVQKTERDFLDRILVDALNTALAVRMVRHFVDPTKFAPPLSSGLSRERLQRACDYIEAHLEDRLSLADLAGIACLSPYHFSRSFKQAVGVGPQRFVTERRIERAKTLMRRTRQPLALIALEVGFNDQSHLTQVFRRATGMTPGRFRADLA